MSIEFSSGTTITSDWLNDINDFFYTTFGGQTGGGITAATGRTALQLSSADSPTFTGLSIGDGLVSALSLNFSNDLDTGIFRSGANSFDLVAAGATVGRVTAAGLAVTGVITSTGAISNASLSMVGDRLEEFATNGVAQVAVNYNGYNGGTTQFRNFTVYNGKQTAIAEFTSTGLAVTGAISANSATISDTNGVLNLNATNTGYSRLSLQNTGGQYYFGVNDSAASAFGGTAYSQVIVAPAGRVIESSITGTGVITSVSSTGLAVTGNVTLNGATPLLTLAATGAFSYIQFTNSGGATKAGIVLTNSSGITQIRSEQTSIMNYDASATYGTFSSTGLAVTGALSCSTNLTVTGGTITTGSTTALSLATSGGTQARIGHIASSVNYPELRGNTTTLPALIWAEGETNVGLALSSKGTGDVRLFTNATAAEQVRVTHTASANRYITLTGSNGGNPTIGTSAGDLAVSTNLNVIGSGGQAIISTGTTDGADTSTLYLCGGGSASADRGGRIYACGNEAGGTGRVDLIAGNVAGGAINLYTGATVARVSIKENGSVILNASGSALATTATDGFTYIPTCAGAPTGVPTAVTGAAPMVIDSTNNKLYFYSGGAWRDAGP